MARPRRRSRPRWASAGARWCATGRKSGGARPRSLTARHDVVLDPVAPHGDRVIRRAGNGFDTTRTIGENDARCCRCIRQQECPVPQNPKDPNHPGRRVDWSHTQFETRAIRAGQDPDAEYNSVIVPIYQTSTYRHNAIGDFNGYEYSRTDNPTRTALQASVASLEGGEWGLAFSSGTAATREVATLLDPGDHILMTTDAYGGTFRLFDTVFRKYGVETSTADLSDLDAAKAAVRSNTRMIW